MERINPLGKTALQIEQENQGRLAACRMHLFLPKRARELWCSRYLCERCGGEVSPEAKHWYEVGMRHASNAVLDTLTTSKKVADETTRILPAIKDTQAITLEGDSFSPQSIGVLCNALAPEKKACALCADTGMHRVGKFLPGCPACGKVGP